MRIPPGTVQIRINCFPCDRPGTKTLGEFQDYSWPEGKDGKAEDENPVKDNDHAMHSLRYLVMELNGAGSAAFAPVTWEAAGCGVG